MIKTVLAFLYLFVSIMILLPFGMFAMIFFFIGIKKFSALIIYRIAQGWAKSILLVTRNKATVTGRENIPRKGGVCFVSNHDGFFDIVLLLAYCGRPIGMIAKKELAYIPILNLWIYMIGGFFIDRGNIRKSINTINKGVKRIKSGGGMIIFPEGSRSKGRGLLPFHPGSLKLATIARAPIVPVALYGSSGAFENDYHIKKSPLKVTFCTPIYTANLSPEERKLTLSDRIHTVINEQLIVSSRQ
jgi:1-acyl-sn-glycerol-3-phosphate acyltransferase